MKSFTFQAPANILFEAGAARKMPELVAQYGAKRVMLVTDKGVRGAGLTREAEAALAAARIRSRVFEDVVADPPSHVIESAAEAVPGSEDRTRAVDRRRQRARYRQARGLSGQNRPIGSTISTVSASPKGSACH